MRFFLSIFSFPINLSDVENMFLYEWEKSDEQVENRVEIDICSLRNVNHEKFNHFVSNLIEFKFEVTIVLSVYFWPMDML